MGTNGKILIVANFRGWAWDHKAYNLKRNLLDYGLKSDIAYMYDYVSDPKTGWHDIGYHPDTSLDFSQYDAVILFSLTLLPLLNKTLDYDRTFMGICSHVSYNGDPKNEQDIKLLNSFRGVFVLNHILYKTFQPLVDKLHYCPNGVDTAYFRPSTVPGTLEQLVVGWVGDPFHLCGKGYYEFIEPLARDPRLLLLTATKQSGYRSYSEMPTFYNSIDVYVSASQEEGTPNPCLEAAACGRPVVSTAVGNMPEFIEHGSNGFLSTRCPDSIREYLRLLDRDRALLQHLGRNARETSLAWDWKLKVKNFVDMISPLLAPIPFK